MQFKLAEMATEAVGCEALIDRCLAEHMRGGRTTRGHAVVELCARGQLA